MVGKKKRKIRSGQLLGSHQKCWLWGRHAVMETLRAGKWIPIEIAYSSETLEPALLKELLQLTEYLDVPALDLQRDELQRRCGSTEHQGLMAKMPPYPYGSPETLLQKLHAKSAVLVLAGIQDPFNFGSILRSADLFSFDAVVVPISQQSGVSSHVARSSVGAVNYLDIVEVPDLIAFCQKMSDEGLKLIAATEHGDQSPAQVDFTRGCAVVIGNEGSGVPADLMKICETLACIPLQGHVGSLNAAVAAGILCYELQRQRLA
ncbi:TrmH family RNA methyltransferase [Planctomicrobium sp. SH668]|uniref:TrmH family RNA methyltransferase n=1 Tax=Planctomicrobium sp. SH668 TaxID=3448126 RepID=UPI003F5B1002